MADRQRRFVSLVVLRMGLGGRRKGEHVLWPGTCGTPFIGQGRERKGHEREEIDSHEGGSVMAIKMAVLLSLDDNSWRI